MLGLARSAVSPLKRVSVASTSRSLITLTPHSLSNLETRWVKLPDSEKGAIADALNAKAKGDWNNLSLEEKRALYWIAYGKYYARNPKSSETFPKVWFWVGSSVIVSYVGYYIFNTYYKPPLRTRTPEWKEATIKSAIEKKQNPFSGAYADHLKEQAKN